LVLTGYDRLSVVFATAYHLRTDVPRQSGKLEVVELYNQILSPAILYCGPFWCL